MRNLHNSRLCRLHVVARTGLHRENHRIRQMDHLNLGLTDPHRFDEDNVPTHGVQDLNGLSAGARQAAQMAPRGHAADKNAGIGEMAAQPDSIAQDRPARKRARRIDRQDGNTLIGGPEPADELGGQRAFSHAGSARQGHDSGVAPMPVKGFQERAGGWVPVLDPADEPGGGEEVPRQNGLKPCIDG